MNPLPQSKRLFLLSLFKNTGLRCGKGFSLWEKLAFARYEQMTDVGIIRLTPHPPPTGAPSPPGEG